jgi:hypothetical protein
MKQHAMMQQTAKRNNKTNKILNLKKMQNDFHVDADFVATFNTTTWYSSPLGSISKRGVFHC